MKKKSNEGKRTRHYSKIDEENRKELRPIMPNRKNCIFCEQTFTDHSELNNREHCYRGKCEKDFKDTIGDSLID